MRKTSCLHWSFWAFSLMIALPLGWTAPIRAEQNADDGHHNRGLPAEHTDRDEQLRSLLRGLHPWGPIGTPLPSGAELVSPDRFLTLWAGGAAAPLSPTVHRGRDRDDDAEEHGGHPNFDAIHEHTVNRFLKAHPDLTDLARIVNGNPIPGQGAAPTADGNWMIFPPDLSHAVETMGHSTTLSWIYDSVLFAGNRSAQLDLYTQTYDFLAQLGHSATGAATGGVLIGQLPTPASLADASLATIGDALTTIGRNWSAIVAQIPPHSVIALLGCDAETGATPRTSSLYGDRSGSYCGPIPGGLYATVNFFNKSFPTCVKDQGARGTCHTFGVTSATEELYAMQQGLTVNLSEQDEMEHYRLLWQRALYNDGGDPWEEINDEMTLNYFFPYEKQWDYNPAYNRDDSVVPFTHSCDNVPGEPCSDTAPQSAVACGEFLRSIWCILYDPGIKGTKYQPTAATYFWNSTNPELSVEYMVLELAFNNAVVMTFTVSPGFEHPHQGFITYDPADLAKTPLGGHVMHVVSYISNHDLAQQLPNAPAGSGGGYFIVKNSWSNCFGDGGYVYVPWDYMKAEVTQAFAVSKVN